MPDSKKLQSFLVEIEEVCARYQYTLSPTLNVGPTGITPGFKVLDRVPAKKPKATKPPKKKKR